MANLGQVFDPASVPAADLMPVGVRTLMQVVDSDVVATKAGTGTILKLSMKVLDGQRMGAMHFEQINIANPNPTAVSIGQQMLKKLCAAIGHVGPLQDSVVLHNKPFFATFKTQEGKDGFEDKSTITKFEPASGGANAAPQQQAFAQTPQQSAPPPQQQPAQAGGKRPWG